MILPLLAEDLSKLSISSVALSHLVRNFLSCKSILKCFLWSKFSHTKLNARWHLVDRLFTELGKSNQRENFRALFYVALAGIGYIVPRKHCYFLAAIFIFL